MKCYLNFSIHVAFLGLTSCGNTIHNVTCIDEIYDNRAIILEEFKNTTVAVRNYDLATKYNFKVYDKRGYTFYSLEEELGTDTLNLLSSGNADNAGNVFRSDSPDSTSYVLEYVQDKLHQMEIYSITGVSAEDQHLGITLTITACDLHKIYYVENIGLVENEEWKKYFSGINKLDEHWYYDPEGQSGIFPHQENR